MMIGGGQMNISPVSTKEKLFSAAKSLWRRTSRILSKPLISTAFCVALVLLLLSIDLVLPRGATAAIGYCIIVVLVAGTGRANLLIWLTFVCTVLTWAGFAFEPAGALAWMSAFDRLMVTGVLWLTAILCWRRVQLREALAHKAMELAARGHELGVSNVALQQFASVLSHDLRAPLSSIGLNVELLVLGLDDPDDNQTEAIGSIRRGIQDMTQMMDNILQSSRASHGQTLTSSNEVDCEEVLRDVLDRLKASVVETHATIRHGALPRVAGDRTQLSRVFQNLIQNAIKYHGCLSPEILISADESPEGWTITVRDNGIGISPEQSLNLFDMFQRGWSDETQFVGAGIGLSVCKQIINRHGGRIWIESKPGEGTAVMFTLARPHGRTQSTGQPAKHVAPPAPGSLRRHVCSLLNRSFHVTSNNNFKSRKTPFS
jgi:signal transduction histidine kinase